MRVRAALGSLVFLVVVPGIVVGLVPWLVTGWEGDGWGPVAAVVGWALIGAGVGVLLSAFGRFVVEGLGTPAPIAPTERLVVGGLYRYVRNPMYLAVFAAIVGQALVLGRVVLLAYAALVLAVTAAFVRLYEEPTLARQYGEKYERYRRHVPGWLPRPPGARRR